MRTAEDRGDETKDGQVPSNSELDNLPQKNFKKGSVEDKSMNRKYMHILSFVY